jgi:hypothetical protein
MYPKYDEDFYGWTIATAQLMREGKMNELDIENLIEEIESMGRSEKRQLVNRLSVLITHLLKWHYQPSLQGRSWHLTIEHQRRQLKKLFKGNPSLKNKSKEILKESYEDACIQAESETGLLRSVFPSNCPYTFEQCLDEEFYPI